MVKKNLRFQSLWNFFGLSNEDRILLYSEIHEIVFNGGGGYDWATVYNMPIWLRRFTFRKLKEHFEKINNNDNVLVNNDPKNMVHKPNIPQPTFNTSSSKIKTK